LALLDLVGGAAPDTIREAGAAALGPLQTVSGAIASPVVGWIEETGRFASGEERSQLWKEQAPDVTQVRGEQRVADLDRLLGLLSAAELTVIPARVVAYPMINLDVANVLVDTGSDDGVGADQAVISGLGLVGRTTAVTAGTAEVKLLSARDSAVGGRILRTGQACVVVGTGDPNSLSVRVLDPLADIQINDAVLTFGSKDGRPFPTDLPIGVVAAIDDDGAGGRLIRLKPAANLTALDLVGVVSNAGARGERAALSGPEEPAPQPEPEPEVYVDPQFQPQVEVPYQDPALAPAGGYFTGGAVQ
jgi:rod shape-determining protein MreC